MKEKKQNYIQPGDLSGRQSVRTTFRFSKEANEALNWLSKRYGVPMKDVLHSAIEELADYSQEKGGPTPSRRSTNDLHEKDIMTIALRAGVILSKPDNGVKIKDGPDLTVRRTVVVTKKTLKTLKRLSVKNKVSRDYIINSAIIFAKNFTYSVDDVKLKKYQEAYDLINDYFSKGEELESQLKNLLGDDDPIVESMGYAVIGVMNTHTEIEEELEKRKRG